MTSAPHGPPPPSAPHPPASSLQSPSTDPDPDPAGLFQDAQQTAAYARHRPHYPPQLYAQLYSRAFPDRAGPPFPDLTVVDVATGSGQALGPLPRDFGACVALDVSAAQLRGVPDELRRQRRLTLRQGDAHATGLPPASVDLVTVGQALHWFRLEEFYLECRRILKPSGALAAWTYDYGKLYGFAGAQELYEQLYGGTLAGHWAKGRELVDAYYLGIEPGPQHFGEVVRLQLPMPSAPTLDELVRSWSAYRSFTRAHPSAPDPAEQFRQQAAARMAAEGVGGRRLSLQRTITLLIALRPVARALL
ncbi:hypothetical protein PLESTF_001750200 [Pleodorina starrii]|nr:hypothetical protein PLESTF_001750200 [Pleodorina starrii]